MKNPWIEGTVSGEGSDLSNQFPVFGGDMRGQKNTVLAFLALAISFVSLTVSCGTSPTDDAFDNPGRSTSEAYEFHFNSNSLGSPLETYYVVSVGETQAGQQIFEVALPREQIFNYVEHPINGDGPLGAGDYIIRVFDPLEYVWDTREDFFYVEGL